MRSQALQMKNATVAMLLVCPLLFLIIGFAVAGSEEPEPDTPPPILILSEASGFTFASGSAALSDEMGAALSGGVADSIAAFAERYNCDIVEVIGHTDGQRVTQTSNTDDSLAVMAEGRRVVNVTPGSNSDLGLMRAWSVVSFLRAVPKLNGLTFHGFSGGQIIAPSGELVATGDYSDRAAARRIEIRVRRSAKITNVQTQ